MSLAAPFLFVEAAPGGQWALLHLGSPLDWASGNDRRPVRHSYLHDDPRVFKLTVAWIREESGLEEVAIRT